MGKNSVLFVSPDVQANFLNSGIMNRAMGKKVFCPSITLCTIAALTDERDWNMEVYDELLGQDLLARKDLDQFDIIALTAWDPNKIRAMEIARELRDRGHYVVLGGPFLSQHVKEVMRDDNPFNVLFTGEGEYTWPQFLDDWRKGKVKPHYHQEETINMYDSPAPRYDLVNLDDYLCGLTQTSRGCPFMCEFCDSIILFGRKMRTKRTEIVIQELDYIYDHEMVSTFISDDNFTADRKYVKELLHTIIDWRKDKDPQFVIGCQVSMELSVDDECLELMARAGVNYCYTGLESPSKEVLRNAKKYQNIRLDMGKAVEKMNTFGLSVMSGLILGFDENDRNSFREYWDFVRSTRIPTMVAYILSAPVGTPLRKRLEEEGRLVDNDFSIGELFKTNVIPRLLTVEELNIGFRWFASKIFDDAEFVKRVWAKCEILNSRKIKTEGVYNWNTIMRNLKKAMKFYSFFMLHPVLCKPIFRLMIKLVPVMLRYPTKVNHMFQDLLMFQRFQAYYIQHGMAVEKTEDPIFPARSAKLEEKFAALLSAKTA